VIASKNWTLNAAAAARKKFDGGLKGLSTTSTPRKFDSVKVGEIRRRRGLADRARETVALLQREVPAFIAANL